MYLAPTTRRARSPWFQSINQKGNWFLIETEWLLRQIWGGKAQPLQLSYSGWVFFCFAFIIIIIIIIFFKFIFFILLFSAAPVPLPRHSHSGGRRLALRGFRDVLPGQGRPAPGAAAPRPQRGSARPARGIRSRDRSGEQQRKYINRITHRARKGRTKNRPGKGT